MTLTAAALLIFVCTLAASYGWGMRGAVIGGEKGALLPGALIGMSIALFSGIDIMKENMFVFAACGALSMGYGGFEPYAETADFMLHDTAEYKSVKKCFAGLFIKGANWFGIAFSMLSMGINALTGKVYGAYDIIILFALIPLIQLLGIKIFNKPFDRDKGIFPKIYFSRSSREEWGGNLLTLVAVGITAIIRHDTLTLIFMLVGIVFGGIGWFFSMWLCFVTSKKRNIYIDTWKIMEFSFGAIGGLAFSVCFALSYGTIAGLYSGVNSLWSPVLSSDTAAWIVFALIIVCAAQYLLEKKFGKTAQRVFELIERAVYYSALLCLCVLGNIKAARLAAFCVILWVLYEENTFGGRLNGLHFAKAGKVIMTVLFMLGVAGEAFFSNGYGVLPTIVMYTTVYILSDMLYYITTYKKVGSITTVHAYFILQSIVLSALMLSA